MSKTKTANVNGNREYVCRLCGKKVVMTRHDWKKLPTDLKRLCYDCRYSRTRDCVPLREPHPYGHPYWPPAMF